GGGNLCAQSGLKFIIAPTGFKFAFPNLMSFAPHPNPPPLIFPPLCLSPNIGGQEPTSIDTLVLNLLNPGPFPLGIPEACIPPQGLLGNSPYVLFGGPSLPAPLITGCSQYNVRQQIGNFLYVADRQANEIVVLNSNRMTVLDRISVTDPTSLAMGPDLDFLAVSSQLANSVSFIDIDPSSSNFHVVVKTVNVGAGPTGIAWQPEGEDIFVCNTAGSTVTVISGFNLEVRKTLLNALSGPFEVCLLPRLLGFGLNRGVYFGFIINKDGSCSLFESGPDGVNGWGFDDIIGQPEFKFDNPTAIQADHSNFGGAVYIAHQNQLDFDGQPTGLTGGALTLMHLEGLPGIIPLDPGFFVDPSIRDLEFEIDFSIGSDQLTGVPVDFAFDILSNNTILLNLKTAFSPGVPLNVNGKSLVRPLPPGFAIGNLPKFIFCAIPNSDEGPGVVDVIQISGAVRFDTNPFIPGTQSIPATGVTGVMGYFRQ
ncbi:MAG: beta-propeller fold lactonase family protein, partial [Planctomycetota bacterium]|nr:beta-propeller fold lactonase family protein [Planctomycetota bacterium]